MPGLSTASQDQLAARSSTGSGANVKKSRIAAAAHSIKGSMEDR